MAVVYFAGHGTERDGRNYLIPIDARLERASDLDLQAMPLSTVLDQIAGATKLKLVILDACRNNVFPLAGGKRAATRGLARIEPEDNTLVVYAAKEGTVADDGERRGHSPFTEAILRRIATPALDVRLLFGAIRDDVAEATNGQQQPHIYGSLGREQIYLSSPKPSTQQNDDGNTAAPVPKPSEKLDTSTSRTNPCDEAQAHWRSAESIGTIAAYDDHIKRFPACSFADLARTKIANLQREEQTEKERRKAQNEKELQRLEERKKNAPDLFAESSASEFGTYFSGLKAGKYAFSLQLDGFEVARQLRFGKLFASSYEDLREWAQQQVEQKGTISINDVENRANELLQDERYLDNLVSQKEWHYTTIAYIRALQFGEMAFATVESGRDPPSTVLEKLARLFPSISIDTKDKTFADIFEKTNAFVQRQISGKGSVSINQIIRELRGCVITSAGGQPKAANS